MPLVGWGGGNFSDRRRSDWESYIGVNLCFCVSAFFFSVVENRVSQILTIHINCQLNLKTSRGELCRMTPIRLIKKKEKPPK